ncbi:YbaB/EbfC family nucleoid-associated protein [Nocardia sp. CA2R105]|uniref:YbaB/EbfC family nucleoid-associated protein n=1 Tax=Nocardia coffeae TaxID=2873381 RepID=UPI001CA656D6|nr:YbaB/EbfC family nucleoid-associated protein [Nocardia coffeae]
MHRKRTRIRHSERYEGRSEGGDRVDPIGDPLQAAHIALTTQRATATSPGGSVTVESAADGRIHAIRLNDRARRADPGELAATIAQVHNAALDQARTAVADTISRLESDPHIQAARRTIAAALNET